MTDSQPPNTSRHFHVVARELVSDTPDRCPYLPQMTFDGLAVTTTGQHYLIMTLHNVARFYVGPDTDTVQRRAQILAAALCQHLAPDHAYLVGQWIQEAWEAALDELTDAFSGDLDTI